MASPLSLTTPCFSKSLNSQSRPFQAPRSVSLSTLSSEPFTLNISSPATSRALRQTSLTNAPSWKPHKQSYSNEPLLTPTTSTGGALPLCSPSHRPHLAPSFSPPYPQAPLPLPIESYLRVRTKKWSLFVITQVSPSTTPSLVSMPPPLLRRTKPRLLLCLDSTHRLSPSFTSSLKRAGAETNARMTTQMLLTVPPLRYRPARRCRQPAC